MREQTKVPRGTRDPRRYSGARTTLASLAAIGSVLAASSCCLLLVPFMMAPSVAWGFGLPFGRKTVSVSNLNCSYRLRFYQGCRAKKCQNRPSVIASASLWLSTAFVVLSIFFPQVMANAAAGLSAR